MGLACGLKDGGCFRHYQGGSIYWTQATGAHFTRGLIKDLWARQGWETGELGYPTIDEFCMKDGCFQGFQGGDIYYSPAGGTHVVPQRVWGTYVSAGGASGLLGYPTGDLNCGLVRGGCFQTFQKGSIYWSPETGAQWIRGAIAQKWGSLGWETGFLGYPTSNEQCWIAGGCFQNFQGGKIYWSLSSGAHFVRGSIFDRWGQLGWENGFGFPTSDENCGLRDGGCFQTFGKGSIYWSPRTGAQEVRGAIADKWGSLGWETGLLGYPTSGEFCGLRAGGCGQRFQNGSIYWSPNTGAHFVKGAIREEWGRYGWEQDFGYPTTDEICGMKNGGCRQVFEGNDHIYWSPQTPASAVPQEFMEPWGRYGWETGRLGYPLNPYVQDLPDGRTEFGVQYQGGWIFYQFRDWNNLGPAQVQWR